MQGYVPITYAQAGDFVLEIYQRGGMGEHVK